MKKLLAIVAIIIVAISCGQKKHGAFAITGSIKNAPGKKVLLMELPFNSSQPVILDSTELKKDGAFTLHGKANEEGIYRLVIDNGPDVILVNDNNEIRVNVDVSNYRNYATEGSPASESLHKFFEDYRQKDSLLAVTFQQYDTLRGKPGNDSIAALLKTKRDTQLAALNTTVKEFINNSNSPAAISYALGIGSRTIPHEELKALADASAKKFPEHSALTQIKNMLAVKAPDNTGNASQQYALLNQQAPDLTMNDLNGKPISISSFRGKYLLVDFWASWCGPCRQENPNVVAAYNQFKNKNFTILGVSLDQEKAAWQTAIAKDQLNWNHMSDLKQWESDAVKAYGFDGIPFNVLVDPQGRIIASGLRGEELQKKLTEVLK